MSLLNDMLRDLSQRQPVLDGAEGYDEQLLQTSSIASKKQHTWIKLSSFFVIVFIAVLGISYASKKLSGAQPVITVEPKKTSAVPNQKEMVPAPNTSVAPITSNAENAVVESAPTEIAASEPATVKTIPAETENTNLQNHIKDLLQQAERAMVMDRLTTPVEDNAYAYYQKILSMSADNNDAKEGLDKIAQRYLSKAQEQSQLGNLAQAEALLQRARFVSARFVDAHTVEFGELSNQTAAVQATQQEIETAVIAQPTQTETIKPFVVAEAVVKEAPSVSVVPNAGWKDEQLARHAQELIQKGKQAEALALLKNFVASEQKPALSAALLAELYIQQANTAAADIILEQTNYLAVDVKAKLKAQILSLQGDDVQAITVMEKNLAAADVNEGYRSLLASLYHKTANYPQSILSYQSLINSFGDKPAYWLGLALAYDGLSQPKNALQAYLRLREFPQLQDQVKQYTDQRISALRSQ
jgi:MSHA biogenesis protein MshN